ncbi:MAG TPA: branched-chain amino acid ABC transporter permease [Gaiellaceae bacterium]|nr:branched-chain amino acid ABC transporter permease [Gaiellaceae bacterium]
MTQSAVATSATRGSGAFERLPPPASLLLVAGAVGLLVGSLRSDVFAQLTVQGLALGAVYGSLALALVLVYRATRVVNFAQGELALATTYIAYQLIKWGLSYWEAFFATLAIAFVLGVVLEVALVRPVQHRSVIAAVIVTVGLFILIDGVVNWIWGGDFKYMQTPFGTGTYHLGSVSIARLYPGMLVVVLISVVLVWALFRFTKLGLGMRAAALRPAESALVGVRVDWMLAIGWGLAAVLGAVAGLMAEPSQFFLDPTLMQPILVYAFAAAVLGGLESPAGAVVGGLAIGVSLNLVVQYVHPITSELQTPFAFAVLLVVLLLKPSGLFGHREVRRV